MKAEIHTLMRGDMSIEIIAETDAEYRLLSHFWRAREYPVGNGKSIGPNGGGMGFYVPLGCLVDEWPADQPEPEEAIDKFKPGLTA